MTQNLYCIHPSKHKSPYISIFDEVVEHKTMCWDEREVRLEETINTVHDQKETIMRIR